MVANSLQTHRILVLCCCLLFALLFYAHPDARAAETTWTGAVDSAWLSPGNWDAGAPTKDDIAIIPVTVNQPEISVGGMVCSGLILEQNATIRVLDSGVPLYPYSLHIIGPGDLDGDGVSDIAERDEGAVVMQPLDVDLDGIPNYADTDSDNDGISDECEFTYGPGDDNKLHPYFPADSDQDYDIDGYTDAEECAEGTDPTDPQDKPTAMPLIGFFGLIALCLLLAVFAVYTRRRAGLRTWRFFSLLLIVLLLPFGLYMGARAVAAATLTVDFALGQTIEEVAALSETDDILEINGASVRPWNGQSTYVNEPVTLKAVGGPVFLGGMRATLTAGVLGQGSLDVESAYTGSDHPMPTTKAVLAGTSAMEIFLGERLTLTPNAEPDWGFHGWLDDASGSDDPLAFQALSNALMITALFGPPGPDLAANFDTGPPSSAQDNDSFTVVIEIENIGQLDTSESPWTDRLLLSRDAVLDEKDYEFAAVLRSSELTAGGSYTASFSVTFPDVAPGHYYVLGVADEEDDVQEDIYRDNNMVAVGITVFDANLAD